ncbi:MAG: NAD-dependent epimerase/dehydratase family protein [Patescibacteria group bacterium]
MKKSTQKLVLVTGGAGFIGSHLCERLVKDGYKVISLDNYFTGSKDNHIDGVEYREGHTKDIEKHIKEIPDIIFHLGEYSRVEQSLLEEDVVYDLNIVGTGGVINFWKKNKCKLVYAGSSTKFGDFGATRLATPYSRSKADNTELVKKIGDAERLPYAITYFYNVYGPGERSGVYGTVIETFKQIYLHGAPISVTSPGNQTRNFTHVYDIVEGLILIGEKGLGDEYGLGNEESFSIIKVAKMFGENITMLPERSGNRMQSDLDTKKVREIGWNTKRYLQGYIEDFIKKNKKGRVREKRVLIFSTTFSPIVGPAEIALEELISKMPDIQFDIITTLFSGGAKKFEKRGENMNIYKVGIGNKMDKYLLPILGYKKAKDLHIKHKYLFTWALMASYAALAGIFLKRKKKLPLLVTLADQKLTEISFLTRKILKIVLSDVDQIYGVNVNQEKHASHIKGKPLRNSIGEGDAFANQLRYSYSEILLNSKK